MSDTSDEPFIMAEELPAEDSLNVDSDDQEQSTYLSPDASRFSKSEYQSITVSSLPSSEPFQSISSQNYDDISLDQADVTSEIHDALDEGYRGLDLGTLHRTLPRQLWHRHENRPHAQFYQPSDSFSRYSSSLKHFIPVRSSNKKKEQMPLDRAGLFSFLTYSWMTPYLKWSFKNGLKAEDIPLCASVDGCDYASQRLEFLWKEEVKKNGLQKASLQRVIWQFIRTRALVDMLLYLISLTFGFMGPVIFIRRLLEFCQDSEGIIWQGALWALGIPLMELCRTVSFGTTWGVAYRTGVRLRSALLAMLYKKVLRLSNLGDKSIGELVNMFANDSQRIFEFATLAPLIVGGPYVAILGSLFIVSLLGPHAVMGLLTFLFFYPVQYGMSRLIGHFRRRTVVVTDQRVRLMNELLSCVKLIKMYAWEKPFSRTIMDIRAKERALLEKFGYVQSTSVALIPCVPIIAVIATFLIHLAAGYDLTPAEAFTIASIYHAMRSALNMFPHSNSAIYEGMVTIKRIESVLSMEEIKPYTQKPLDKRVAIAISDATFAWNTSHKVRKKSKRNRVRQLRMRQDTESEKEDLFPSSGQPVRVLFDIRMLVTKGRLIGICGPVGAGKSSLLSAILGHMNLSHGLVSVDGSFAYVSQQAWIMNCSLKENILFGESFDAKKYYSVIWTCALNQDIASLPAGDETEIGERGINLSGGQRQRVALARALYANKDIYLLDDPLSAVDAHVGKHIFEHCILSALKGKTVLFVTHQLQYLTQCHEVIYMGNGRILDQGTHEALMEQNEQYSSLINMFLNKNSKPNSDEDTSESEVEIFSAEVPAPEHIVPISTRKRIRTISKRSISVSSNGTTHGDSIATINATEKTTENSYGGQLTTEEIIEEGSVPWQTYMIYIQHTGGYCLAFFVIMTFIVNIGSTALSSWWLAYWLNNGVVNATKMVGNETVVYRSISQHPDLYFYQQIYGSFVAIILISTLLRGIFFIKASLHASSLLHNRLFVKMFRSPMRFFDTTPSGRILNIFSRDQDETDSRLPSTVESVIQDLLIITTSIIIVSVVFPWFIIALVLLAMIFYFVTRMFRSAIRDLKRLENVSRSPIYSHVTATVNGLNIVHAFGKEREFITKFMLLFDENSSCYFLFNCSMRWLSVRLDFISVCALGITAALVVILHGIVPAAFAGLAITYAGQLCGLLQYTVRLVTETEARFTSVQRMHTYFQTLENEAPAVIANHRPSENWPRHGSVRFSNVKMKYRPNLPLVLKGISFDIEPKEKIGIVGRTGSGKSSLGTSLFRLVELTSGSIKIDGINIAEIGLEDLRSRLSIIPQEPVLFIGTVRYNLDPFNKYNDDVIWETLEQTNMKAKISSLPAQLDSPVIENGENFSVGERQLLCMARALLRRSKVLFLDEATAAIDTQTDALVQRTLRETFKDCTLLIIAHRLNTVLECDRIMVLQDGKVVEFDKPTVLMENPNSIFHSMMSVADVTTNLFLPEGS